MSDFDEDAPALSNRSLYTTDEEATAVAVQRAAENAVAMRQSTFDERPRLLQLLAGIFVAACSGGLRAQQLASIPLSSAAALGFSDEQSSLVASISTLFFYAALPAGFLLDTRGPRVVLSVGATLAGAGYLGIGLIAGGHIDGSVASMAVASTLIALAVPFLDVGSLLPNVSRFSFDKGTVLIVQESYYALGAFIFSTWYRGFFEGALKDFAYVCAVVIFFGCIVASRVLTAVPLPEYEHDHPWHGHRRFTVSYVLVAAAAVMHFATDIGSDIGVEALSGTTVFRTVACVSVALLLGHVALPFVGKREYLDPIAPGAGNFSYANAPAMPPERRFRRVRRGSTAVLRVHIDAPFSPTREVHHKATKSGRSSFDTPKRVTVGGDGPQQDATAINTSGLRRTGSGYDSDSRGDADAIRSRQSTGGRSGTSSRGRLMPGEERPNVAPPNDDASAPLLRQETASPAEVVAGSRRRPVFGPEVASDSDSSSGSSTDSEEAARLAAKARRSFREAQNRPRAPSAMYTGDRTGVIRRQSSLSEQAGTRDSTRSSQAFMPLDGESADSFQISSSLRYSIRSGPDLWLIGAVLVAVWGCEAVFVTNGSRFIEALNKGTASKQERDLQASIGLIAQFIGHVAVGVLDGRTVQKTLLFVFPPLMCIVASGVVLVFPAPAVHFSVGLAGLAGAWVKATVVLIMKHLFCATNVGAHYGFVCTLGALGPAVINLLFFQLMYHHDAMGDAHGPGVPNTVCTDRMCIVPPTVVCGIAAFGALFAAVALHVRTMRLHRVYVE